MNRVNKIIFFKVVDTIKSSRACNILFICDFHWSKNATFQWHSNKCLFFNKRTNSLTFIPQHSSEDSYTMSSPPQFQQTFTTAPATGPPWVVQFHCWTMHSWLYRSNALARIISTHSIRVVLSLIVGRICTLSGSALSLRCLKVSLKWALVQIENPSRMSSTCSSVKGIHGI